MVVLQKNLAGEGGLEEWRYLAKIKTSQKIQKLEGMICISK
jgi:hypothetical protein